MAKLPFTYYLHDGYDSFEMAEFLEEQLEIDIVDTPLKEKIGRPFYEVTLECELDTETGAVTLKEARL